MQPMANEPQKIVMKLPIAVNIAIPEGKHKIWWKKMQIYAMMQPMANKPQKIIKELPIAIKIANPGKKHQIWWKKCRFMLWCSRWRMSRRKSSRSSQSPSGSPFLIESTDNEWLNIIFIWLHFGLELYEIDAFIQVSWVKTSFRLTPELTKEYRGEWSEPYGVSKWMSNASKQANGYATGPVLYASIS